VIQELGRVIKGLREQVKAQQAALKALETR
jgi:hypothetical protein